MKKILLTLAVLATAVLNAKVELGTPFTDNAVLQREKPIAVWGTADAGEKITVTLNTGQAAVTAEAVAGKDGRWLATLPRQAAVATPCTLTVQGRGDKIELTNILIGEVWICAGQSNMEWRVSASGNPEEEIAAGNHPLIRHMKIQRDFGNASPNPRSQVLVQNSGWEICSPETVGGFTAAGYYFARTLQKETNVPIGLLATAWGGTRIETWLPYKVVTSDPSMEAVREVLKNDIGNFPAREKRYVQQKAAWDDAREKAKEDGKSFNKKAPVRPQRQQFASYLYNGMIHPLLPYGARGVIWYQGESNAARHTEYSHLFRALISSWREAFQQDLSFYWVQLAAYRARDSQKTHYAYLRETQSQALVLPKTGEAVAIDIGEEANIHPKNKQEVGRRLALHALAKDYGKKVACDGPRFASMNISGNTVTITLNNAAGLHTADKAPVAALELAGADKVFHPAKAAIQNGKLIASSDEVSAPVAARYAFRNFPKPEANVYNGDKLPLAPFRTDDWPEE